MNNENKILEDIVCLEFSSTEYNYLKNVLNETFNILKKFSKNMRTEKYYILENILKNQFSIS